MTWSSYLSRAVSGNLETCPSGVRGFDKSPESLRLRRMSAILLGRAGAESGWTKGAVGRVGVEA